MLAGRHSQESRCLALQTREHTPRASARPPACSNAHLRSIRSTAPRAIGTRIQTPPWSAEHQHRGPGTTDQLGSLGSHCTWGNRHSVRGMVCGLLTGCLQRAKDLRMAAASAVSAEPGTPNTGLLCPGHASENEQCSSFSAHGQLSVGKIAQLHPSCGWP